MKRKLPATASVATQAGGKKLFAPAADRNADALCDLVALNAPAHGKALEIASGTGQHVISFARSCPGLGWQPTDVDDTRIASIDAYAAEAGLANLQPAQHLDATHKGWATTYGPLDLVVLVNLLHLITDQQAETLVSEAMSALDHGGTAIFYGPFKRNGTLTSDGDARFDAQLRGADPGIGYKDDTQMRSWLEHGKAANVMEVSMPANNLAYIAAKSIG